MVKPEEIAEKFVKQLEESLVDHLKSEVNKMVKTAVSLQFDALNKRLDGLAKTMDLWKNDLDEDRKMLNALIVAAGYNKTDLDAIAKNLEKLPKKVEEKVESSVESAVNSAVPAAVENSFEVTSSNPKKKVDVVRRQKRWFQFWKRR